MCLSETQIHIANGHAILNKVLILVEQNLEVLVKLQFSVTSTRMQFWHSKPKTTLSQSTLIIFLCGFVWFFPPISQEFVEFGSILKIILRLALLQWIYHFNWVVVASFLELKIKINQLSVWQLTHCMHVCVSFLRWFEHVEGIHHNCEYLCCRCPVTSGNHAFSLPLSSPGVSVQSYSGNHFYPSQSQWSAVIRKLQTQLFHIEMLFKQFAYTVVIK